MAAANDNQSRDYQRMLVFISTNTRLLNNDQFYGMLNLFQDLLTPDKLTQFQNGTLPKLEFLHELERKERLSADNLGYLLDLLKDVNSHELARKVESFRDSGVWSNESESESESEISPTATAHITQSNLQQAGETITQVLQMGINPTNPTNREIYARFNYRDMAGVTAGALVLGGTCIVLRNYGDDPVHAARLMAYVVLPAGTFLKFVLQHSIIMVIEVTNLDALDELWNRYKSGQLKTHMDQELLTEEGKKLLKDGSVETMLQISEENCKDVRRHLKLNVAASTTSDTVESPKTQTHPRLVHIAAHTSYTSSEEETSSDSCPESLDRCYPRVQVEALASQISPTYSEEETSSDSGFEPRIPVESLESQISPTSSEKEISSDSGHFSDVTEKIPQTHCSYAPEDIHMSKMNAYLVLGKHYMSCEQYEDSVQLIKKCIDVARECHDHTTEMEARLVMGKTYFLQNQHDSAIRCARQCIDIAEKIETKAAQAHAYNVLGNIHCSIDHCLDHIAEHTRIKAAEAHAYGLLGNIHCSLDHPEDALMYTTKSLKIAENYGFKDVEENSWLLLASVLCSLKHYDDAISYGEKVTKSGEKWRERKAHLVLGRIYQAMEKYDSAMHHTKKTLEMAKEAEDKQGEIDACLIMIMVHKGLNHYDDVVLCSKECIQLAQAIGNTTTEMEAYLALGKAYQQLGQEVDALDCCRKCIDIVEAADGHVKMHVYLALGKLYQSLNLYDDACRYTEMAIDLANESHESEVEMNAFQTLQKSLAAIKPVIGRTYDDEPKAIRNLPFHVRKQIAVELDNATQAQFSDVARGIIKQIRPSQIVSLRRRPSPTMALLEELDTMVPSQPVSTLLSACIKAKVQTVVTILQNYIESFLRPKQSDRLRLPIRRSNESQDSGIDGDEPLSL